MIKSAGARIFDTASHSSVSTNPFTRSGSRFQTSRPSARGLSRKARRYELRLRGPPVFRHQLGDQFLFGCPPVRVLFDPAREAVSDVLRPLRPDIFDNDPRGQSG